MPPISPRRTSDLLHALYPYEDSNPGLRRGPTNHLASQMSIKLRCYTRYMLYTVLAFDPTFLHSFNVTVSKIHISNLMEVVPGVLYLTSIVIVSYHAQNCVGKNMNCLVAVRACMLVMLSDSVNQNMLFSSYLNFQSVSSLWTYLSTLTFFRNRKGGSPKEHFREMLFSSGSAHKIPKRPLEIRRFGTCQGCGKWFQNTHILTWMLEKLYRYHISSSKHWQVKQRTYSYTNNTQSAEKSVFEKNRESLEYNKKWVPGCLFEEIW